MGGVISNTFSFPIGLYLIFISVCEFGIGIGCSSIEWIHGFLGEFHTSCSEYIHNRVSYDSLSPESSSRIGNSERRIRSRIGSHFDIRKLQTLGEIGDIGYS